METEITLLGEHLDPMFSKKLEEVASRIGDEHQILIYKDSASIDSAKAVSQ